MTYVTLIGLLSATGSDRGKHWLLTERDVDLQSGVLTIREIKVREVPLRSCRGFNSHCPCTLRKTAR